MARGPEATERIGWGLADLGYIGVFGTDFVVRGESAVALEINCRMQASTWLLGEVELEEEQLPTMLRHVLELRGQATAAKADLAPVQAAQLTLRHQGPPGRLTGAPVSGVYRMTGGALQWRGKGYGLLECGPDDCVVMHVPQTGTQLMPGVPLARLVSRRPFTTPDGSALDTHGRQLLEGLNTRFTVEAT
ncbi:hypothetical protein J7I98_39470 [Streptomyces sp. ISL-98]|uniref:hypothetical protein n=1 Tax=Streptomyces sp. ISL-98 TaxID=2819192 RepID=UPI001BE807D7|nr:hypothetical protein [Streptomyces sp. ISL-98]MBT2511746.1 hypothetical protein [Streptomyces sp. ISL-98]